MKKSCKELENSIKSLSKQIDLFRKNVKNPKVSEKIYNKMLVERATYIKALEEQRTQTVFSRLAKKINFKKRSEKKLVCDYFHA